MSMSHGHSKNVAQPAPKKRPRSKNIPIESLTPKGKINRYKAKEVSNKGKN